MKKILINCLLFIFLISFFNSCKKSTDTPSVNYDGSTFRKNFFSQNGVISQTFIINASTYQTIIGTKGTRVNFSPNSFLTQSGGSVTGTIQIELKEIYTKKDMILSGVFPTSNGNPLVSGGEFFLMASQGGQQLKLVNKNAVTIELPISNTNTSGNMNEFYTSLNAIDKTNWGNAKDTIAVIQDSITGGTLTYFYSFAIDSLNWGNCDQFWVSANNNHFGVNIADTSFNGRNTMVVVSYNGINQATNLTEYNSSTHFFEPDHSPYLPVGMNVTFIAFSQKGTQWYSAFHSTTIGSNHVENMTLSTTTFAQIQTALGNLP